MTLNALALAVVIVGLGLVWSVLVKKFPQLKLLDLSTLAKERQAEVKARILRGRFDRALGGFGERVDKTAGRLAAALGGFYGQVRARLKAIERSFERDRKLTPEERETKIVVLLQEARNNAQLERYGMAEEAAIEALKFDPQRAEAYRVLADVYLGQGLQEQARQTLEYLVRHDSQDGTAYERLGATQVILGLWPEAEASYLKAIELSNKPSQIRVELGAALLKMGEPGKALDQFRAALIDEPYNPRYLDYFLETSILLGDAPTAREAYGILETVNPDNQKLPEFRERIDKIGPIA